VGFLHGRGEAARCLKVILFNMDPNIVFNGENGFFINRSNMYLGSSPDLVGQSTALGKFGGEISVRVTLNISI
jgi:hypothetical protein